MQRQDVPAVGSLDTAHWLTQAGRGGGGKGEIQEKNKKVQAVGHDNGSHYAQEQHGAMVKTSKGGLGSGGEGKGLYLLGIIRNIQEV